MAEPNTEKDAAELGVTLRLPKETLTRIDDLVARRVTRIPRHAWLLEAVYEKLDKEERVEGALDIFWENNTDVTATRRYRLRFLSLRREKGGPLAPLTLVGDESLERYLEELGFAPQNARGWLQKLRTDKTVSIPNVMMPADRAGPYGFRIPGLGIHRGLPDGRMAILYHDHPKNESAVIRGDRIIVLGSAGNIEKEATVTPDGKVYILLAKLMTAAGGINVKFKEATNEEAKDFLAIHREFIVD